MAQFDDHTRDNSKKDVHDFRTKQQTDFEVIKGFDASATAKKTMFQSEGSRYTKVTNLDGYLQTKSEYKDEEVSCTLFPKSFIRHL